MRVWLLLFTSLIVSGCVTANTDIEGRDSGLFMPAVRAKFGGLGSDGTALAQATGEIEFAMVGGEDSQRLIAGQTVVFDSAFTGPALLEHDWELQTLNLTWHAAIPFNEYVSLGMLGGLTINSLGIRVESGTQSEREHILAVGPGLGLRFTVIPTYWLTLYAQAMSYYALSDRNEVDLQTAEIGAHIKINPNVGFIVGWRTWEYDAESAAETLIGLVELDESDIELENHGFMAVLVFEF